MRMRSLFIGCLVVLATCDSASSPSCSPQAGCTCNSGMSCSFSPTTCVPDPRNGVCYLTCDDHTTCTGTCLDRCSIECQGNSNCTATVGSNAGVICDGTSTCNITCTGSCFLSCGGSATCEVNCPDNPPIYVPTGVTQYCG